MTGGPTSGGRLAWAALSALDRDRSTPKPGTFFPVGLLLFPGGSAPFPRWICSAFAARAGNSKRCSPPSPWKVLRFRLVPKCMVP